MKIYESLYIFSRYKQDIRYLFEIMIDSGYRERKQNDWNLKDQTHYVALYNTILLNSCSYLDEYNKHFLANSETKFHERIKSIKRIAKPALKEIYKWTGLRNYRNQMIAHNFRVDEREFSFNLIGEYDAPRTYADLALLRKHLMMIQGIIEAEFRSELPNLNAFINSFPVRKPVKQHPNVENELRSVLSEINHLCDIRGKDYNLDMNLFLNL